jgi:hypothetical protein
MAHILKLIALTNGRTTPHDNRFVVEYDPYWVDGDRTGVLPHLLVRKLVTTDKAENALRFATAKDALAYYLVVCPNVPKRPWDQKANRPLTAYHCVIEKV